MMTEKEFKERYAELYQKQKREREERKEGIEQEIDYITNDIIDVYNQIVDLSIGRQEVIKKILKFTIKGILNSKILMKDNIKSEYTDNFFKEQLVITLNK